MQSYKYSKIPIDTMNRQINLRLPRELLKKAEQYAKEKGYGSIQEFIKETIREKLFPPEELTEEEMRIVKRIIKMNNDNDSWGTEDELWKALEN